MVPSWIAQIIRSYEEDEEILQEASSTQESSLYSSSQLSHHGL